MQYMLMIYLEENALNESERARCYEDSAQYATQLRAKGQCLSVAPLEPTATATSVRVRDGRRFVTNGPFAETHEQLGGFFLIEATDLDQAIEIAAGVPAGTWGTVEIRPLVQIPNLPVV